MSVTDSPSELTQVDDTNITRPTRQLSAKALELYATNKDTYLQKLEDVWSQVEFHLISTTSLIDLSALQDSERALIVSYDKYCAVSKDYIEFLLRAKTADAQASLTHHREMISKHKEVVSDALNSIDAQKQPLLEKESVISHRTGHSGRSQRSDTSSILASKLAKLQASKARVQFAEDEIKIKREQALLSEKEQISEASFKHEQAVRSANVARKQAELDAELKLLHDRKEAAAAEAEYKAVQSICNDFEEPILQNDKVESPEIRTSQFVDTHFGDSRKPNIVDTPNAKNAYCENPGQAVYAPPQSKLNPHAPVFQHNGYSGKQNTTMTTQSNEHIMGMEFTRFLLKKDMLLSRLSHFNDRPETYSIWKARFKEIMGELQTTASEELDMLIKWLGPDSSRQALSIRLANASNPLRGVDQIWSRLDDRYGCPEMVEAALKQKILNFPKLTNKDSKRLYDLADILSEIEAVKEDTRYKSLLGYYDSSSGIIPIVNKLPYNIQEKWTMHAANYKKMNNMSFPPFSIFVEFIRELSKIKNDPGFQYEVTGNPSKRERFPRVSGTGIHVSNNKTNLHGQNNMQSANGTSCPIHKTSKHNLNQCKAFRAKPISERRILLRNYGFCFKCCNSTSHAQRNCRGKVYCTECKNSSHATALHLNVDTSRDGLDAAGSGLSHGEEASSQIKETVNTGVDAKCTEICNGFPGKSCAKIILVNVYSEGNPRNTLRCYAILDEQSNRCLAKTAFFDYFNIGSNNIEYTLSSCAGRITTYGRIASGLVIQSLDKDVNLKLPTLIECNDIPDNRDEIPTPEVAEHFTHLNDITDGLRPIDDSAEILLLIGRDLLEAHHVLEQRIGKQNTPYAQRLRLGWVIVGEACLGKVHKPESVNVYKTNWISSCRESIFVPCQNRFQVKENYVSSKEQSYTDLSLEDSSGSFSDERDFGIGIFKLTEHNNKPGLSMEDRDFIKIMDTKFRKDEHGNWSAPLPFRQNRPALPNNRKQAVKRAVILDSSLKKNPIKGEHFKAFMQRIFENGHAEIAPPLSNTEECWYLPIFGVYHPKKVNQIRGVFDSSAKYQDISLNDVLLPGPNLTNSLLGVLLRFRQDVIAITADIQQMFYCFYVNKEHRNYLRFIWYRDNDPNKELIEYRMCVHVFGNSPSPAIATYGLRKSARLAEAKYGNDMRRFVEHNFYVDDGLISLPTSLDAVDLMKRTQTALQCEGNLRLHKIVSNSREVMRSFPTEDLVSEFKDLDLDEDSLPLQRSLGIIWDIKSDVFAFQVSSEDRPYTRRGMLSTVNSIFDPLGFVAPITVRGKLLLRKVCQSNDLGWDDPLTIDYETEWKNWKTSLKHLDNLHVPRTYSPLPSNQVKNRELHVFTDASEKAIAAVAYMRVTGNNDQIHVGFVFGKSKVAPIHGHTIPRLELCGAVLGVEVAQEVCNQLGINLRSVKMYTDSKVVLGYISNTSRRFYTYVSNRVERIRKETDSAQWNFVTTDKNPADCATRYLSSDCLQDSMWLQGPDFLRVSDQLDEGSNTNFPLIEPEFDNEVRRVGSCKTKVSKNIGLNSHRFERFSSWKSLVRALGNLMHIASSFHNPSVCKGWHVCPNSNIPFQQVELFIIRQVQKETYSREISCIESGKPLFRDSSILELNPFIDDCGVLRVGGRLNYGKFSINEKNPVIVPKCYIASLLVNYHHEKVRHQGRQFTEGALRSEGLWIVGAKRLISSLIYNCIKCRKLRGRTETQKMSDLPADRLEPGPPFTYIGIDTFGPWSILTRKTRGGCANSKRWAILFTCLTTRAIHIEVIEEMSTSSFVNAFRRFESIRGPVKIIRSDRGSNFIGSTDLLNVQAINVEDKDINEYLHERGTVWIFNPPHASHMGGVWERMIGICRRILDSMLLDSSCKLTHEVLVTLMAEVCAIVNSRPLTNVSSDPESPMILTPSMLLTQKVNIPINITDNSHYKDMYKAQWRRTQYLTDLFWSRWRDEYLKTLQNRRKWNEERPNLQINDLVLLKEKDLCRNKWPIGLITRTFASDDGKVRKLEVRIIKDGKPTTYIRPISEIIVLHSG